MKRRPNYFIDNQHSAPYWLSHKPIYAINNYGEIDGEYKNRSNISAMSVGAAQWRNNSDFEPSVKVWRCENNEISRQSEETTFTRAMDIAMLAIQVYAKVVKGKEFIDISDIHGENTIEKIEGVNYNYDTELKEYLNANKKDIENHIKFLKKVIEENEF